MTLSTLTYTRQPKAWSLSFNPDFLRSQTARPKKISLLSLTKSFLATLSLSWKKERQWKHFLRNELLVWVRVTLTWMSLESFVSCKVGDTFPNSLRDRYYLPVAESSLFVFACRLPNLTSNHPGRITCKKNPIGLRREKGNDIGRTFSPGMNASPLLIDILQSESFKINHNLKSEG